MPQDIRLVYVWIDSYKCLSNIGFCLVDDIDISYDKASHEVRIVKNNDYPECFRSLRDIAAIVGENGSGKTTFVEVIKQAEANGWIDCGFVLYEVDGGLMTAFKTNEKASYQENEKLRPNLAVDSNMGYTSEPTTKSRNFGPLRFIHIDGVKHLCDSQNKDSRLTNTIERLEELSDKLKILEDTEHFSVSYPLGVIDLTDLWRRAYSEYQQWWRSSKENGGEQPRTHLLNETVSSICETPPTFADDNKTKAIVYLTLMVLRPIFRKLTGNSFYFDLWFMAAVSKSYQLSNNQYLSSLQSKFSVYSQVPEDSENNVAFKLSLMESVIESVEFLVNEYEQALSVSEQGLLSFHFDLTNKQKLKDFDFVASQLNDKSESFNILSYQWQGISLGQLTLIELFAKLRYKIDSKNELMYPILVTLDEPELTLHPEWQRLFIKMLTEFFYDSELFKNINIQFVLTSHSPFILSDLVNSNVLYLRQTKQSDGHFAANIHELLLDNFFMTKSIGEVAAELVSDCYNYLIGRPSARIKSMAEAEAVAEQVADKLLKSELNRLIEQKRRKELLSDKSIGERKAYVQKLVDNKQVDELMELIEGSK